MRPRPPPKPGQGVSFVRTVRAPACARESATPNRPTDPESGVERHEPSGMSPQSTPRPLVLVVDDDPDVRGILGMLLTNEGYEVVTAVDGADALGYAADERIGLIVLDLQMPRIEGDVFCRAYRERGGKAPVLVVTASDIDAETVARLGADAYLPKPFDIEAALDTMRRLLDSNRAE
jgi:CheY-like chemotaxis protein